MKRMKTVIDRDDDRVFRQSARVEPINGLVQLEHAQPVPLDGSQPLLELARADEQLGSEPHLVGKGESVVAKYFQPSTRQPSGDGE
jgi:hypothetical protein